MKKKKKLKRFSIIILGIWLILFLARFSFSKIDYARVDNGKKPIFNYDALYYNDGGTEVYYCFGYSLTRFYRVRIENDLPVGYDKGPIIEYKMNWLFFPLENKKNIKFIPNNVTYIHSTEE